MNERQRKLSWLLINLVLVVLEGYLSYAVFFRRGDGPDFSRFQYFAHYTSFCIFLSSFLLVAGCLVELMTSKRRDYYLFKLFRYASVSASTTLFILIVFLFLPLEKFNIVKYYSSEKLLECILCPLIAYVSFTRFGSYKGFGKKEAMAATAPVVIYHTVIVILNAKGVITGPYPIQSVRSMSTAAVIFWFIAIASVTYIVSYSLLLVTELRTGR